MSRPSVWIAAGLLCLALLLPLSFPAAASVVDDVQAVTPPAVDDVLEQNRPFLDDTGVPRALPASPVSALISALNALSVEVGIVRDSTAAVLAANLPPDVAGRLAHVSQDLLSCTQVTKDHKAAIPDDQWDEILATGGGLQAADFQDVRLCAESLWTSSLALEASLAAFTPPGCAGGFDPTQQIDIWPVLFFEGNCRNTVYKNDYLLLVDLGGHDTYKNNVGANMVDINFAPSSSPVPGLRGFGNAKGCDRALGGLLAGDCTPLAALLLDMQGEDTFGVKQSPVIDAQCTADPVVRRMVTVGVGFLGAGFLIDSDEHNDDYTGKTGAIGAGHIFGFGILLDRGGNDQYLAVRNAQGFALVGGVGILRDEAGNDGYDFYLPAPLDPDAPNESPGAGGVIDDEDVCDNRLRFLQGGGNVLPITAGILVDTGGQDAYRGGFSDDFGAPAGEGRGGSQGFGNNQAFGILVDRTTGSDTYVIVDQVGEQGGPPRGNGETILPDADCSTSACTGGVFIDDGPKVR